MMVLIFLSRETNLLFGPTHLLSCSRLGHDRNNNTHDIWAMAQIAIPYTCGELSNTHIHLDIVLSFEKSE